MQNVRAVVGISLLLAIIALACPIPADCESGKHSAVTPVDRTSDWWKKRHEAIKDRMKHGKVDLVFIGDSITHSWEKSTNHEWEDNGADVWAKRYASRNAVNMGFSGDRTQNVLWRLDNGELDGISPRLAVVHIGSNNSNYEDNTSEEIADGIICISETLHGRFPDMKILVLGIFPRGEKPNPQRVKNEKANALVMKHIKARTADGNKQLHYLDIGPKLMSHEGTISKEVMTDFLHPTAKGYEIWADSMEPKVVELLEKNK